jgi:hypothetical protein
MSVQCDTCLRNPSCKAESIKKDKAYDCRFWRGRHGATTPLEVLKKDQERAVREKAEEETK